MIRTVRGAALAMTAAVALLSATPALADWTLVGGNPGIYRVYADKAGARTEGDHVNMWGLYDFIMPDVAVTGEPHQSTQALHEYDCKEVRVRLLSFVDYSDHMGAGKVIAATSDPVGVQPGRWEPIVPGAVDELLWKLACSR